MDSRGSITRFLVLAAAAAIAVVLVGAFTRGPTEPDRVTSRCVPRLMQDWRDGSIDGSYPLPCYQAAITDLPADLREYSSAEDDIRQARARRIAERAES
jgi:hypothetical protein